MIGLSRHAYQVIYLHHNKIGLHRGILPSLVFFFLPMVPILSKMPGSSFFSFFNVEVGEDGVRGLGEAIIHVCNPNTSTWFHIQ